MVKRSLPSRIRDSARAKGAPIVLIRHTRPHKRNDFFTENNVEQM
jgi:hypothetical protein